MILEVIVNCGVCGDATLCTAWFKFGNSLKNPRNLHLDNSIVSDDDQCDLEELTSFLEASDSEDEAAVPETGGLYLTFLLLTSFFEACHLTHELECTELLKITHQGISGQYTEYKLNTYYC